ncbi:MAG: DUF4827 domain-containing protein [Prevotella sp.]|nr:DUF4827 domain-containing protein [Prevotella sp.]
MTLLTFLSSCSKEETYAEQREREIDNISNFISTNNIEVISEERFALQDYTTEENQYVLFNSNGVYMNILNDGPKAGTVLAEGTSDDVLVRYQEYNINGDSIQTTNRIPLYGTLCDKFSVRNYYGTYIASYIYGRMSNYYGSTQVPSGWLVPLKYIKLGRLIEDDDRYATVRLIVPHDQGTSAASSGVYACYYFLTYEEDR